MTLKEKRIEWKARYDAWKQSGYSVVDWCQHQKIKVHQMYYWIRQFEGNSGSKLDPAATQWLTVQVNEGTPPSGCGSILLHFGSISVEVPPGANMDLLSDVVHVLKNQC